MVAVSELFRSGFFGLFQHLAQWSGAPWAADLAEGVKKAHALGFGLLVVLVILFLPNGIVGDWRKIQRFFRFRWGGE
jgi:branched-chain amino acid transport system permease protein